MFLVWQSAINCYQDRHLFFKLFPKFKQRDFESRLILFIRLYFDYERREIAPKGTEPPRRPSGDEKGKLNLNDVLLRQFSVQQISDVVWHGWTFQFQAGVGINNAVRRTSNALVVAGDKRHFAHGHPGFERERRG